jgi:hypothetical protein
MVMADIQGSVDDFGVRELSDRAAPGDPFARLLAGVQMKRASAISLDLRDLVERQVVPRLYDAHCDKPQENDLTKGRNDLRETASQLILPAVSALEDEVTALGDRLLLNDQAGACDRIDALRIEGRSLECLYLDLLTPTASYLRRLWSDDLCGFAEATLALLNLQGVLRQFAPAFRAERHAPESGLRTLLASPKLAGVDVTAAMFGLMMMSEFFRRGGWEAWIEPDLSSATFGDAVRYQWFDVVELLAANDGQLDGIASSIRTIRRGSANRSVGVIVCGQVFVDHPEFVRMVGADLTSSDPRASLIQANTFVSWPTPPARLR